MKNTSVGFSTEIFNQYKLKQAKKKIAQKSGIDMPNPNIARRQIMATNAMKVQA